MRLVHDHQEIVGEEVEQRVGRLAGLAAAEPAGVVLDAGTVADLQQHLHVEARPRRQPLRLQQLALVAEDLQPLLQLLADALDGLLDALLGRDEVLGRVDVQLLERPQRLAGERVDDRQRVDLVAEQLDAEAELLVGRPDLDHVAAHAELAALERDVVALVLDVDEAQQQFVAVDDLALGQDDHLALVIARRAQAVDARDAGDDDHILAADQGAGGGQAQPVDVLVDQRVFLDVDVALRDVGFGLVVVVIADEVVDGVAREEGPELLVELGGQRLVVRQHQRRLAELGDHVAAVNVLPVPVAPSSVWQRPAVAEAFDELGDGLGLIAGGLELAGRAGTWRPCPA